jgi:hypothetical protein
VRTPDGQLYLVWNNLRLGVSSAAVLDALGYAAVPPYLVGSAWINSLPAGPDLVAPGVPGVGRPGPAVGGRVSTVGQLFKVDGGAPGTDGEYFVMRSDGLSALTPTGAAMLLADPNTRKAYPGRPVDALPLSAAALAGAPRSATISVTAQHPTGIPRLAELGSGEAPCVHLGLDAGRGPTAQVGLRAVPADTAPTRQADRLLADRAVVAPGAGLLIRDQPAPGVPDGTLSLLVDIGVRYPLHGDKTLSALGYDKVSPVPVPAPLLALFPVGPPLDPESAHASMSFAGSVDKAQLGTGADGGN